MCSYIIKIWIISIVFSLSNTCSWAIKKDSIKCHQLIDAGWKIIDENPEKAKRFFDSANLYLDPNSYPSLSASLSNKLGVYYSYVNIPDSCLSYFLTALKTRIKYNLQEDIPKSYLNIGSYYLENENYNHALKYLNKGLVIALQQNDSIEIEKFYNNIGILYNEKGIYDTALIYYQGMLRINQKLDKNLSSDYLNIGAAFHDTHKYDSAIYYYDKAIIEASKNSNFIDLGMIFKNKGMVLEKLNNPENALIFFFKSDSIAQKIKNKKLQSDIYYLVYNLLQKQENYSGAITYYKKHIKLKTEFINENASKTLIELQTKFETQEKDDEINLLKKDNKTKSQTLNQLYLTSGILLLLLLILGVFYALFRQRQKTKNLEQQKHIDDLMRQKEMERVNAMLSGQENERKRIAEALHDQIGSLLSTVKHYLSSIDKKDKHELITKAESQLDNAVEEMRRISQNLVSGVLVKFGLIAAVKELANTIRDSGTLDIKVISTGFDERLNSDMEIYVYRILQELISNALKHAKAQSIVIRLKQEKENILLIIKDDGIGFSPQSIDKNKTTGLNNIIQRVELKKGRIKIDSESQKGTTIGIEMPYQ